MNRKVLTVCFLIILNLSLSAQNLAGIINSYAKITAIDTCTAQLTTNSTAGFEVGMAVILIQMQGASISSGDNGNFGTVNNMSAAGIFEENEIAFLGQNSIILKNKIGGNFEPIAGSVQLISFPKRTLATVADTIFAKKWDGSTGGILAIQAQKLTLNAPISANLCGFRGGLAVSGSGNNCNWAIPQNNFSYDLNNWRGAPKGEGIAKFINGKEAGKGAQANGGGGGNDHNSGGGGGANTKSGGEGGKNDEPATFGCRGENPGRGGRNLAINGPIRLFLGGGGGAGHGNNGVNSAGGQGGGIHIIRCDTLAGSNPAIFANGESAKNAFGDGAGGGGAGGSMLLIIGKKMVEPSIFLLGGLGGNMDALTTDRCFGPGGGGAGGQLFSNLSTQTGGLNNVNFTGGIAGVILSSTAGCTGNSNGANAGENGSFQLFSTSIPATNQPIGAPQITQQPTNLLACEGENATVSIEFSGGGTPQWQLNAGNGWVDILDNNLAFSGEQSPVLTISNPQFAQNGWEFRCKIIATGCNFNEIISGKSVLEVLAAPTVNFNFTINNGFSVDFESQMANLDGFIWDFGDGETSIAENPTHVYLMPGPYSVSLRGWNGCDSVALSLLVNPQIFPLANFEVLDTIFACGNTVEINFKNTSSGNPTNFDWQFPGGLPTSSNLEEPVITYAASGNYTAILNATNSAGADTENKKFTIVLEQPPTANFTAAINGLVISFNNLSSGSNNYFWDFGNGITSTAKNPVYIYGFGGQYVVTLVVQNSCGAAIFQKTINLAYSGVADLGAKCGLKIFPNPSENIFLVEFSEFKSTHFEAQLVDYQGIVKRNFIFSEKKSEIDLSDLPKGIYFLHLKNELGSVVRRLVKF